MKAVLKGFLHQAIAKINILFYIA